MENITRIYLLLFIIFPIVIHTQSTLRYDLMEEEQLPQRVSNIFTDSGLRERYSPDIISILRLEIVTHEQNYDDFFTVTSLGALTVSSRLDRDQICPHRQICVINLDLRIQPTQYFDIIKVELVILDKNDNSPSFGDSNTFTLNIIEGPQTDIPHGLPLATDPDSPVYSIGSYELTGHSDFFTLQTFTGNDGTIEPQLKILTALDREITSRYLLTLSAMDRGTPRRTGSVTIVVDVSDTNDQYPVFDRQLYEQPISEGLSPGASVLTVRATDRDIGANAEIVYSFASSVDQDTRSAFNINANSGAITVNGQLDYERKKEYSFSVVGRDRGQSSLSSQTRVLIHVSDVNDNPPIIELDTSAPVQVPENNTRESFVAYIRISDPDSGRNGEFNCSMDSSSFVLRQLHQTDYTLVTNTVLDREERDEYFVTILCRDYGSPIKSSSAVVEISVSDINDNYPVLQQSVFRYNVMEGNQTGQTLMTARATDADIGENGVITYSLQSSSLFHRNSFAVDPTIGDIRITGPIDYEASQSFELLLIARDNGNPSLSSNATIVITVLDQDDEKPIFVFNTNRTEGFYFTVSEHENANAFVGSLVAQDRDSEPFNTITYQITILRSNDSSETLPVRVDPESGNVYTTMEFDREIKSTYTFTAIAIGRAPNFWQAHASVAINVVDTNDYPPVFAFPNTNNNTVHLTVSPQEGAYVATVHATDRDSEENARLTYSILYDNDQVSFVINENSGVITTAREFYTDLEVAVITVTVRDHGRTPKEDTGFLNVIFTQATVTSSGSDFNEALVIGIAVVAAVVVTVLILAIVCLLRRHKQGKQTADYLKNCHEIMSANQVVNDDEIDSLPPLNSVTGLPYKSGQINNSLDSSNHSSIPVKKAEGHGGVDNLGMIYDSNRGSYLVHPWQQQQQQLANPNTPKNNQDQDSDSINSLDNSDSGRGSNEDSSFPSRQNNSFPTIPQRQPTHPSTRMGHERLNSPHRDISVHGTQGTGPLHVGPLVRHLYPDNKQYYDERVFRNGAGNSSNGGSNNPSVHDRSHDFTTGFSMTSREIPGQPRMHAPSPSPSLQYQQRKPAPIAHRNKSLNLPELPPKKHVHYCSQV